MAAPIPRLEPVTVRMLNCAFWALFSRKVELTYGDFALQWLILTRHDCCSLLFRFPILFVAGVKNGNVDDSLKFWLGIKGEYIYTFHDCVSVNVYAQVGNRESSRHRSEREGGLARGREMPIITVARHSFVALPMTLAFELVGKAYPVRPCMAFGSSTLSQLPAHGEGS